MKYIKKESSTTETKLIEFALHQQVNKLQKYNIL